jgi:D-sedoheptulose 7-phosphate isomerase
MKKKIESYIEKLTSSLNADVTNEISLLGEALLKVWKSKKVVYICGNGGSAGNAIHLANDLIYGAGIQHGVGMRVEALTSNPAVLTCLANDMGYEHIFSEQLRVKANSGDLLIVLSGSGNSTNVVNALNTGNLLGMDTFAILGYDGGRCKKIAKNPIHFYINDMQIAEDLQLIVGHMCMQWLSEQNFEA